MALDSKVQVVIYIDQTCNSWYLITHEGSLAASHGWARWGRGQKDLIYPHIAAKPFLDVKRNCISVTPITLHPETFRTRTTY